LCQEKEQGKHPQSPPDNDDFIGSAFLQRDTMLRRDAAKRPVAAEAWRRQLGGGGGSLAAAWRATRRKRGGGGM